MNNIDVMKKSQEIMEYIVRLRRDFHQHPEESFKEFRTTDIIVEELKKMGIEVNRISETGAIGILKGALPGKTVALRADIDALSVMEDTGLPYSSENKGVMHACGHDAHAAMLLGAAKILSEMRDGIKGTIKFIFQPAEETATGAKKMIECGALKNPDVDFIFGIHIWSDTPMGKVMVQEGPLMASGDMWNLDIKGKSSHGSAPWQGVDAIVCAAAVINGMQTIVSRKNDVRSPIVVNIGTIHGGERYNVTPGTVKIEGMNRAFSSEVRKQLPIWIENITKNICAAYECDYNFNYDFVCAVTKNDEEATKLVKKSMAKLIGMENVLPSEKIMGSEDFSEYLEHVPGTIMFLGTRNESKDCCYSHHSNHFKIDEDALPIGAASYVQVALDYLN